MVRKMHYLTFKSSDECIGEVFKKFSYSDIVPISFYTHPPEGDRDSKYKDNIREIGRDIQLKIRLSNFDSVRSF